MTLTLFSQVATKEPMVAFGVRWLGPVLALGCGGVLLVLVVVIAVAVALSAKRKE